MPADDAAVARTASRRGGGGGGRAWSVALPVAAAAAMAWISWGKWADVQVDFGREVYVPWRIVEGDVLYRDIAHYQGPLSFHVNAALFAVFGPGIRTLAVANLFLAAATAWALHGLLRRVAGAAGATAGVLAFTLLFAFAHPLNGGNYNYVTPYAHEATHGLLLGLAAVAGALARRDGAGRGATVACGAALGLTLLTRADTALAAAAGVATVVALARAARPGEGAGGFDRRDGAILLGCAALPVVAAAGLLAAAMPLADALRGVGAPWISLASAEVRDLRFYREGMGLDAPLARAGEVAVIALLWAAVLALPAALAMGAHRLGRGAVAAAGVALAVGAACWAFTRDEAGRVRLVAGTPRALPVAMLALGAWGAVAAVRGGGGAGPRGSASPAAPVLGPGGASPAAPAPDPVALAAVAVFALATLGKTLLQARLHDYGFIHSMPAATLAAAVLVGSLPRVAARAGGSARVAALGGGAAVALYAALHVGFTAGQYARKTVPVGEGPDRVLADDRGVVVNGVLEAVSARARPGATLAVLPEGVLVNYLLRLRNPTPYVNHMPPEMILFGGEDAVLARYRAAGPDFVVLLHKDTTEYGARFFGKDYAKEFVPWVIGAYRLVAEVGARPFTGPGFGALVLERR